MEKDSKNYFKFTLAFVSCLLVRLIPFRVPNVEPIMASMMPVSRIFGKFSTFFFAVSSILFYDILTHTLGVQTFFTALAYGVIALWSVNYFKKNQANVSNFIRFSIMGTLFYDVVTGLTVGPIFFHQSFIGSIVGQIPFTILHLTGNIIFAIVLSPAIYHFMIKKKKTENESFINILNPKII